MYNWTAKGKLTKYTQYLPSYAVHGKDAGLIPQLSLDVTHGLHLEERIKIADMVLPFIGICEVR